MNQANYNTLLPLLNLLPSSQITSHCNSLDFLLILLIIDLMFSMLVIDHCLFCSHLDQEIKLI